MTSYDWRTDKDFALDSHCSVQILSKLDMAALYENKPFQIHTASM